MFTTPRSAALSAALLIGLSGLTAPAVHAQSEQIQAATEAAAFGGDRSQDCALDWGAAGNLPATGNIEGLSHVANPYKNEENTSAGALEVHGWGGKHVRIPVAAAYPIEKGATLTVTLPAGAGAETVTFQESPDGWIQRYYPAPYAKASVAEYFGEPTWDGNVVTFTTVQRIPKNASFDLRFTATGDQLQGETRAQLTGAWDPLQVVQARDEANAHAVPDCFRPATEERNGNRTDRCEVEWYSDAVLDRRFHDWTNNGFIHKVRSPLQTDGHATADAPGSMEVQHYFTGNDTLWLRIPVGTDSDMGDARLVVDLPEIPGHEWTVEPTGTPFYPVRDYDAVEPLPEGRLEGSQVVYEIGDFPAGSAFTAYVNMSLTPEEFDELTAPAGEGEWSNLFHPGATLTGEYAEGVEDCTALPDDPAGSAPLLGSALIGLSGLAGSALLSSGGDSGSAVPDHDAPDHDAPAPDAPGAPGGDRPAEEVPATGPVGSPDPKAQAQQQALNVRPVVHTGQHTAPVTQEKAPVATVAQQQTQLADTGVSGALKVLVTGLIAAALGGALLMLRRRA